MGSITYIKGDVLKIGDIPRILLHSCNCNGTWGGGIAYQLALKYPDAEEEYMSKCERHVCGLLGKCLMLNTERDPNLVIGCLFTAAFGGPDQTDSMILKYTEKALEHFKKQIEKDESLQNRKIIMPKINSGIFGVPWEETEKLLIKSDLDVTVYVI